MSCSREWREQSVSHVGMAARLVDDLRGNATLQTIAVWSDTLLPLAPLMSRGSPGGSRASSSSARGTPDPIIWISSFGAAANPRHRFVG